MNRFNKWLCVWQTVLAGLLVAPVFVSSADLFLPPKHHSNAIIPIQHPQPYIRFHRQHTNNNAKNLETLNSRIILSSHGESMHNTIPNAEKPVDTIHKLHRIEQLQQKREPSIYSDQQLGAKNKTFFDEDDGKNVMRPHGQPGNVSTQFIDDGNAAMLKRESTVRFNRYKRNATKPMSFAEHLINKLSANNAAVNFSQSSSPDFWLPLDIKSTIYDYSSVDGRTRNNNKNVKSIFPPQSHVVIINGPTRIYGAGTESKFPPFLEFFVQRIQKYFSVYKYEDLSRPVLPSQILSDEDSGNVSDADNVLDVVTEATLEDT